MKICWTPQNQLQSRAATELMNNAEDNMICYETEYEMLICREHEYTMWNLYNHLCNKHTTVSIEQHHVIIKKYVQYKLQKSGKM